ncbi:hypothetical protein LCGC14_1506650, partial [marine sediment metagenome]
MESLEPRLLLAGQVGPLPYPLTLLEPLGSMASSGGAVGTFDSPGETDGWTLDLIAGQTLAVAARPLDGSLDVGLALVDASSVVLASVDAQAAGGAETLRAVQIEADGTYTIEITAGLGSGSYEMTVWLNAQIEAEQSGADNDDLATAEDLSGAWIDLGDGAHRAVIAGSLGVLAWEDFESGIFGPEWSTWVSDPEGRIWLTDAEGTADGHYAMVMDRPTRADTPTLNEAVWTVDLVDEDAVWLSFRHRKIADLEDPFDGDFTGHYYADGVAISADGVTWHPVFDADEGGYLFQRQTVIDLSAEAAEVGMVLGQGFQVKFQKSGKGWGPAMTDGRVWDKLLISRPEVDYYRLDLSAGEVANIVLAGLPEAVMEVAVLDSTGAALA